MWTYMIRRLLLAVPTLVGASLIVFAMVHLAPGDPIAAVMPADATRAEVEAAKRAYGFDKPLHYWAGIILIIFFSVQLSWQPAMGAGGDGGLGEYLRHLTLPTVALSLIPLGVITRVVRSAALDVLAQEFVLALGAKGLGRPRVFGHVVKNAAPQILTVLGLQFGFQLGGSVLVEAVFSWPGTGYLLNLAIFQRDIPVLQGVILVLSAFFVVLNLGVDILQSLFDPRIARH